MSKFVWYFFGVALLIMVIITCYTIANINCSPYSCDYSYGYDEYGSYGINYDCGNKYDFNFYYCRHVRNGFIVKIIIYFIGSILCFLMGGN